MHENAVSTPRYRTQTPPPKEKQRNKKPNKNDKTKRINPRQPPSKPANIKVSGLPSMVLLRW